MSLFQESISLGSISKSIIPGGLWKSQWAAGTVSFGDPYWDNVASLLHFNTGNTTITDVKGKTWTVAGNASANGTAKYGAYAGAFDGTGDYISTPDSSDYQFGNSSFTIEFWINPSDWTGGQEGLCGVWSNTDSAQSWVFYKDPGGVLKFMYDLGGVDTSTFSVDAATSGIVNGSWFHIALVRANAILLLFVNGVVKASFNLSTNTFKTASGGTLRIGTVTGAESYFNGLIDDFRITKGIARYLGDFTPPTEAFADSIYSDTVDYFYNNVVSSLHFDGDLVDEKGKTWTAVGNAAATGTAKYGANGLVLDGTGDYVSTATNADFNFGTGDFTVEGWLLANDTSYRFILGNSVNASSHMMIAVNVPVGGTPQIAIGRAGVDWPIQFNPGVSFPTGSYVHWAVTRSGVDNRCFIGGTQVGSTVSDNTNWSMLDPRIGYQEGGTYWNGLIDDFRITKGVARYTSNFTPAQANPDTAPTDSDPYYGNVVSLLHFDNTIADQKGVAWTASGNATATGEAKFGTKALTCDGVGDWISTTNTALRGTTRTYEFWMKIRTFNASNHLLIHSGGTQNNWATTTGIDFYVMVLESVKRLQVEYSDGAGSRSFLVSGNNAFVADTWYHVAIVFDAAATNKGRIYIDGVANGVSTGTFVPISTWSQFSIGANFLTAAGENVLIDDFRVTDIARYTENFTPPTASFPNN